MADLMSTPQYSELRTLLQDMVKKDLLGPAGGPEEIIKEPNVRGRYILGLLAPKGQSIIPDEQEDIAVGGADEAEEGRLSTPLIQSTSMLPSSIGMTFSVEKSAESLQITARWGQYLRIYLEPIDNQSEQDSQSLQDEEEKEKDAETEKNEHKETPKKPKLVWERRQIEGTSDPFALRKGKFGPWYPDPENEEVYVRGLMRERNDAWTITIYLINAQTEQKRNKDEAWVFQPEIIVRSNDDSPVFIKRQLPPELETDQAEDRRMAMLYRKDLEFAVGHGVGVSVDLAPYSWERAVEVRTLVMPSYEVEQMAPPSSEEIPELGYAVLDMKTLADIESGGFATALNPLIDAYEAWIQELQERIKPDEITPDLIPYDADAKGVIKECYESLNRIRQGIALLDTDNEAAEAFRFANHVMALQRVRSIYTRGLRQGKETKLEEVDVPINHSWYPFQLAFVLLNLPEIADPTHQNRSTSSSAIADLLWYPTGGGKTEAYLGVAAFTMAIRRLQGTVGGYDGSAGVTVLMRYTLRLLTLQQFQRAAALICACEIIRRGDPTKWGEEPFRIGLWVGMRSTPNWTKYADEIIKQDHGIYQGSPIGGRGTPAQLTNCPWCGKPINPGKNIRVELYASGRGRTFQYCSDERGACPFSFRASPDEGLPIVVVDEEVYRLLPTLLIATVDKFAQLPWKGETQMLFGRVNGYCPRHGYRSPEIEGTDQHRRRGRLEAVRTQPAGPLRPPDLIIQDELHLISGPLGTMVGLYETAIDQLATWELDGVKVRPKVIASTATIRRAQSQIHNLFLRDVKIFPPPGLDVSDNFFSRRVPSSETTPGRLYTGVCAPGTRHKTVLIRVYAAYMAAAQILYEKYGRAADPWMTMVGYFSSLRELGGMRRISDDTLRTRLRKMEQRGLANRFINPFNTDELTSRKGGTDIPKILDRLEAVFDPAIVEERKARREAGETTEHLKYPLDIVLATNMISVGVDVGRLGLMVVTGQPKTTAEYIQATSRVGRAFPGVVCTVFNWARPRDMSHYERFIHYHSTFYQQVEALSVTPFSSRALDRGLSAVLISELRLRDEEMNANDRAGKISWENRHIESLLNDISRRAALVRADNEYGNYVNRMLKERVDRWMNRAQTTEAPATLAYISKGGLQVSLLKKPEEEDWDTFTCLNSLRDVEPNTALILRDYGMDRREGESDERASE